MINYPRYPLVCHIFSYIVHCWDHTHWTKVQKIGIKYWRLNPNQLVILDFMNKVLTVFIEKKTFPMVSSRFVLSWSTDYTSIQIQDPPNLFLVLFFADAAVSLCITVYNCVSLCSATPNSWEPTHLNISTTLRA